MLKIEFENNLNRLNENKGGFSMSDRELIEKFYFMVLGKYFKRTNCGDCYKDALIEINIRYKKTNTINKMSNFKLKNGVVLISNQIPDVMSYKNTSDILSIKFLKINPDFINFFAIYPENWEELVNTTEKVDEIESELAENDTEIIQGEGTKVTKKATKKDIYNDNNE